jgi:type VI secretion system protein ImpJ
MTGTTIGNVASKVLWGEGLLLRPQHFQRQDQHHEHRLYKSIRAVNPYAWGVEALQIERDALASNVLRVLALALRFQDGEWVDAPGADELPDTVDLSQLTQQTVTYYAALPGLKPCSGNFAQPGQATKTVRFVQANQETPDLYTQAAPASVSYLRKTVRLVPEFEPRDAYLSFPLLRLRRAPSGAFELDTSFVPPSLSVGAAPSLFQQVRRLLDALQAKVSSLYGHHRAPSRNVIEFRSGDMSSFWLLHTASALMTFSRSGTLADLPTYRHADPGPGFDKMFQIIRELLDTVISSKYFAIVLNEVRPSYHHGMRMLQAQSMAIYVPSGMKGLRLDLLAVAA